MKRCDITTADVLRAYAANWTQPRVYIPVEQRLMTQFNVPFAKDTETYFDSRWKAVWAAMEREHARGYIEYGINLRAGWLSPKGKLKLIELCGPLLQEVGP